MVETPIFGSYSHSFGPKRVETSYIHTRSEKKLCFYRRFDTAYIRVDSALPLCLFIT